MTEKNKTSKAPNKPFLYWSEHRLLKMQNEVIIWFCRLMFEMYNFEKTNKKSQFGICCKEKLQFSCETTGGALEPCLAFFLNNGVDHLSAFVLKIDCTSSVGEGLL